MTDQAARPTKLTPTSDEIAQLCRVRHNPEGQAKQYLQAGKRLIETRNTNTALDEDGHRILNYGLFSMWLEFRAAHGDKGTRVFDHVIGRERLAESWPPTAGNVSQIGGQHDDKDQDETA